MKVLYTGGDGQLANQLKATSTSLEIYYPSKEECNLLSVDSINEYVRVNSEFDIVITGANQFPGNIQYFNCASFEIPAKHLLLIEKLSRKPKYFINLTSGLKQTDEHYLYRAQKCYAEDLFIRYFGFENNRDTHFINLFPGHIDDKDLRKDIAVKIMYMLEHIDEYRETQYVYDQSSNSIVNFRYA